MTYFAFRNLELFFRDKTAVILSLLAEVIIMVLYIVFMRDNLLEIFTGVKNIEMILDSWMISGIMGITPVTASMGAYGIMIEDRMGKIDRDLSISPLSDAEVISGYLLSAALAAVIMSLAVLVMSEIYMQLMYGDVAGRGNMARIYAMICMSSLCCSAMILLPVYFIRSSNALAGCCTILGALIGFLTGIYLPIGSLSENVGMIIKYFPVSHGVAVFRQLLTIPVIETYMNAGSRTAAGFNEYMGIYFTDSGEQISASIHIIILVLSAAACTALVIMLRKCMRTR